MPASRRSRWQHGPMGMADGVSHLLDLLARDASGGRVRTAGRRGQGRRAAGADIETLERAKRVALGVREQLEAHRRREAELAALFQTASDLAALTSVDDVLAAIVRRARALLGRDTAYLCLNDDERGDTYMRVTDGSVSAEFQAVRLPSRRRARRAGRAAGSADRVGRLLPRRTVPAHHDDRLRRPRRRPGVDPGGAAQTRLAGDRRAVRRRPTRAGLLPGRGRAAVLAGRARRGRAGQRPAAGRDPGRADRSGAGQRRAAGAERGTSNWPCWPTTGSPSWCCAAAGWRRSPPNSPRCSAVRSICRCRRGRAVGRASRRYRCRRVGGARPAGADPGRRPRPADLRVLERGAVVTALLLLFNRHLAEVANRGRRDLLEDLLTGSVTDPDEIAARAADLDVDLGGPSWCWWLCAAAAPGRRGAGSGVLRRPAPRAVGPGGGAAGAACAR